MAGTKIKFTHEKVKGERRGIKFPSYANPPVTARQPQVDLSNIEFSVTKWNQGYFV